MELSGMKRKETLIDVIMAERQIDTDKELAELLGMTQQQLSYRLKDKISMDTLERIGKLFNKSVKDLLR